MPKNEAEFARAALRAHVATELGESITSPAVLAEVALRLEMAALIQDGEQARANAIVIEAARMQDEADRAFDRRQERNTQCLPIKSKGVT